MTGRKLYLNINVLDAAKQRISGLFDKFENVVISISGGKDSTVLYDLCRAEAIRRDRELHVFFLDQEAEYASTIAQIEWLMSQPHVTPHWYQVPLCMTNAASLQYDHLNAWFEGEAWMREKSPMAIHRIDVPYPQRFYPFFDWFESTWDLRRTVFLVGLRAEESLNRFRSMVKNPAIEDWDWTSKSKEGAMKAYPIYDWTFEDIWHHIAINDIPYNKVYDFMYLRGHIIQDVRVSYLGHEHSFKCLASLHEFEPETYFRLLERMPGAHVAARYANDNYIFNAKKLPPQFETWKAYRDYLLLTYTGQHKERFEKRFTVQAQNEDVYRQQCRQLQINDWEQNVPVVNKQKKKIDTLEKWRKLL